MQLLICLAFNLPTYHLLSICSIYFCFLSPLLLSFGFIKFFYFFILKIIYLFIWLCWVFVAACGIFRCSTRSTRALGCDAQASLQLWQRGFLFSSCDAGSRARGLCSLQHAGSLVEAYEFSSCGTWGQLPRSMWDLSSPTRDRTCIPCIGRWIPDHWTTREFPWIY